MAAATTWNYAVLITCSCSLVLMISSPSVDNSFTTCPTLLLWCRRPAGVLLPFGHDVVLAYSTLLDIYRLFVFSAPRMPQDPITEAVTFTSNQQPIIQLILKVYRLRERSAGSLGSPPPPQDFFSKPSNLSLQKY